MKAVICGAGIAGLALAQRLLCHGWDVVVVDKADGPREQGYMIDFFGPGYDAAEAMGILPRLNELGYQIAGLSYVDGFGRRRAGLTYARFQRAVGGRLLSIMRPDLELALREQVLDRVDMRYGCEIAEIDNGDDSVAVTLSDGTQLNADLLVAADGIHSGVRNKVFGDEQQFLRYLGFHTAAYTFEDQRIYDEIGDRFCLTDSVDRQMGLYGLRDGRVATFTVHRAASPATPEDPQRGVQEEYSGLDWVIPRALANCPEPSGLYYDQVAQIEIPEWSRGRVVLLGDACQAVSLLAGQGASLAVAGAYVLAEQLASSDSVREALDAYQRLWQPVVAEKQRVGRRGAEWVVPSSTRQLIQRRLVLKLANLPWLDRLFATALAGKSNATVSELRSSRAAIMVD